jgi:hypothetical protein
MAHPADAIAIAKPPVITTQLPRSITPEVCAINGLAAQSNASRTRIVFTLIRGFLLI